MWLANRAIRKACGLGEANQIVEWDFGALFSAESLAEEIGNKKIEINFISDFVKHKSVNNEDQVNAIISGLLDLY